MEALRGEDSVTFGDDSADENYQSASDLCLASPSVVGSIVDSVKSTVKSAVEVLPQVSLGLEGEQCLDKEVSSSDDSREDGKQGKLETQGDQFLGKEIQSEGARRMTYAEKLVEDQGVSGLGASEDWSVVDPVSEAQSVVSKNGREGEEEEHDQTNAAAYDSSLSECNQATETDSEESTLSPKVAAEPEIQELAAEKSPSKFHASASVKEPEIQEVDSKQTSSCGASSLDSPTDRVPFTYNEKPSSLRRRNRSFKTSEGGSTSMESGVKGSYSPPSPIHVSPRSLERDSSWTFKDRPKADTDDWSKRFPTRAGATQPKAAENLRGKGQLRGAQSETAAFGSSLGLSETVNVEPSEQKRRVRSPSGYNSDTDDDEADSGITRVGRRSASKGKKKEEEPAGSSMQLGGEDLTSGDTPRREVYRIPDSDEEMLEPGGSSTQSLSLPAKLLVQAVGFQVKLIIHVVAVALWMFNFACSLVSRPIHRTIQVKERATDMATGAVSQGFGLISQVREGVAQTGPLVTKLSKKTMMGCLGSAYVVFVLSLLLIPAFFVDLILVSRMVEEPVQLREILNFDYTQARPSATVPVLSGQELEKAKALPLDKLVSYRKIPAGHNFHINVILTMPESEYNIRLGMFQVTAEMLSARNQILMRQSKPCMLRFRSTPIRLFKTMLYSIPLLMGFSTEAQKLEVTVLQAQEKMIPTASVRILLEPKAGYPQGGGLPELYEAELHLESALPWPKAIIRRWKWTFYVWNGVCLFLFEVAMILCCCRQVLLPGLGGGNSDKENIMIGELKEPSKEDSAAKKSKSKRRVYFEDDISGVAGARGLESGELPVNSLGEADHLNDISDDSDAESGWSMPPLEEAISAVEENVRAMEETVKTLGETLVGGVTEGLGQALTGP